MFLRRRWLRPPDFFLDFAKIFFGAETARSDHGHGSVKAPRGYPDLVIVVHISAPEGTKRFQPMLDFFWCDQEVLCRKGN